MTSRPIIDISVDGPVSAHLDGVPVRLSGAERTVLAALVLDTPRGVTRATLEDLRWPDGAPRTARQAIHNAVSSLRSKTGLQITCHADTYRLTSPVTTDVDRLHAVVAHPDREHLPVDVLRTPRWFSDLPDLRVVASARRHLDRLLRSARETRLAALARSGRLAESADLARALRVAAPADEGAWATEISVLLDAGRRLDATSTYREARRTLRQAHGMDAGRRLRAIEGRIWQDTHTPTPTTPRPAGVLADRQRIRRMLTSGLTVVVSGRAWAGKSHLAHAVAASWPVRAVVIDCGRTRRTPLAAVCQLTGRADPDLLRLEQEHQLRADHDNRGLLDRDLLDRLADRAAAALDDCTLLVLDDVDRLAPLSREVIARTLRRTDARVLATSRQPGVGVPGRDLVEGIALRPLSEDEIARTLQVDPQAAVTVAALTGGSPGLVVLLAEAAQRAGVPMEALDRLAEADRVPDPITDALSMRIAALPRDDLALLEALACGGTTTAPTIDVAALAEAAPGVVQLDGDGQPVFCHPLLRRVVRDRLPAGLRAEVELLHALFRRPSDLRSRPLHLVRGAGSVEGRASAAVGRR